MSDAGPKYDRMWAMLRKKDMKVRSGANMPEVMRLRQKYIYGDDGHPEKLVLYIEAGVKPDLPVRQVSINVQRKFNS